MKDQKILVTGGAGFLGKQIIKDLKKIGISDKNIFVPRSKEYDLRKYQDIEKIFNEFPAEIVIHLATPKGGMGYYKKYPGKVFYDNAIMGMQIMEIARKKNVKKIAIAGSALGYPQNTKIPYSEKDFWKGLPGELEAPYGISHKILSAQGKFYKKEYGLNVIYLILPNLYGPGDHFDENAHVIPSMIKKFKDAKDKKIPKVVFWGDGSASREFLFVEDASELFIKAILDYNDPEPINLGPGNEITIKKLAEKIKKNMNYEEEIFWDPTKPSGAPRRALNYKKAIKFFNFKPKFNIDQGIKKTIEWFNQKSF
ncbi:NAD-dependent epimerase/dehydratase family protein [Candidatus Pacearchaeota archaeon]|nr:NAD-dependent epimerase/dehydratase family protein [Candidatus Pacearchaeota archaeon]